MKEGMSPERRYELIWPFGPILGAGWYRGTWLNCCAWWDCAMEQSKAQVPVQSALRSLDMHGRSECELYEDSARHVQVLVRYPAAK